MRNARFQHHDDAAPEGIIGRMMMTLVAAFVLVLAAGAAYGQPSPVPAGPGGCPFGWAAVGSYCQQPRSPDIPRRR
jgi:hypothetical protein